MNQAVTQMFSVSFSKYLIYQKLDILVMSNMSTGKTAYELRGKIEKIEIELSELNKNPPNIQEVISSTNTLRLNEQLSKINNKQNELISAHAQYSSVMEKLLTAVFEIQMDLKDILKEQSTLISSQAKKKPKAKSKTK